MRMMREKKVDDEAITGNGECLRVLVIYVGRSGDVVDIGGQRKNRWY